MSQSEVLGAGLIFTQELMQFFLPTWAKMCLLA